MRTSYTAGLASPRPDPIALQLHTFLLVILSLGCGGLPVSGIAADDLPVGRALIASAGLLIGWVWLMEVSAGIIAKQTRAGQVDPLIAADWFEKQLTMFRWLGLGVVVMVLVGFGLAPWSDRFDSLLIRGTLRLVPSMIVLVGAWSAEHRYGVRLGYAPPGPRGWFAAILINFRAGAGLLVAPVLVLLAFADAIAWSPIDPRFHNLALLGAMGLFIPIVLPWVVRRVFRTAPIAPEMDDWIGRLIDAAGLHRCIVRRWDTGGVSFNALVAGFVPPLRWVLISDRLLDQLPRQQIAMVVLHEVAHLRRRHVPIRMFAVLPAWVVGAATGKLFAWTLPSATAAGWSSFVGTLSGIVLTLVVLRWVAYRTEHDADVWACRMAGQIAGRVEHVPTTPATAAEVLTTALRRVTFDHPRARQSTWLHPGVAARADVMRAASRNPEIAAGLPNPSGSIDMLVSSESGDVAV